MSMTVTNINEVTVVIIVGHPSRLRFNLVVAKGLNTWDQAHPELKELNDVLHHGRILQDYKTQGFKRSTED